MTEKKGPAKAGTAPCTRVLLTKSVLHIGRQLDRTYKHLVDEPLPPHLAKLVERLGAVNTHVAA